MALTTIGENSIGAGTRFLSGENDDDVLVLEHVIVAATDQYGRGIELRGSNHDVEVRGSVSGNLAVVLGDDFAATTGNILRVTETGQAQGERTGVFLLGSARLDNEGSIQGGEEGIALGLSDAGTIEIRNSGEIVGLYDGIRLLQASGSGTVRLINEGLVNGGQSFSYANGGVGALDLVTNRGLMIGAVVLGVLGTEGDALDNRGGTVRGYVGLGGGDNVVDNRGGTVTGLVYLGGGDDLLDNRGGTVAGEIRGWDGDDTFRPGLSAEAIDGGADFDTLDFSSAARGLTVSLADPSRNTREARDDSFAGIERILGSRHADRLVGDDAANTLLGRGGDDRLAGGAGDDTLGGGAGRDVLRGGSGDDAFLFRAPGRGGDRIADWGSLAGDDDRLLIHAQGFGGGLVAGALDPDQFRVRAGSNAALDADDRFVFRSSDATLWFDRDGKGGAGPVLVADLQDRAVLGAEDIWLL